MQRSTYEPMPWTDAWWDSLSDADLQVLRAEYAARGDCWELREIDDEIRCRAFVARMWARAQKHRTQGGAYAGAH